VLCVAGHGIFRSNSKRSSQGQGQQATQSSTKMAFNSQTKSSNSVGILLEASVSGAAGVGHEAV